MKTITPFLHFTSKHCIAWLCAVCILITAQVGIAQNGLLAEYYDGKDFNRFVEAKFVNNIEDAWYNNPPVDGIDPHDCSIRWTGKLRPGKTETYLFAAKVDDGIRVWIDGLLIINQWNLNDVGIFSGRMELEANKEYDLKVEYFNALREGEIQLLWDIEKSKEDQSWYERVFGVEYQYQIIHSDFFRRPDIPPKTDEVYENEDAAEPEAEVAVETVPKKVVSAPVPKPSPSPPPSTPEVNTEKNYTVTTVAAAKKYIPKNVQFERAEATILPESHADLNTFAKFLKDNPDVTVTIEGHTDVVGSAGANQFLSERRANRVARYLVLQGIIGRRIKTVGYGGSKPLKIPPEGEHHPPNRRVVFKLSGID